MNGYFYKESIKTASVHIGRCSVSLVTWGMQIKTTVRYHFTPTRKMIMKNLKTPKVMSVARILCIVGKNVGCKGLSMATMKTNVAVPQKVKYELAHCSHNFTPRCIP